MVNHIYTGINKELIKQNKNYYRNILIKLKNKNTIYSVGCIILHTTNKFKLLCRFYKIYSFKYNIPLDYINNILINKFPNEINYIILNSYLKNDVSFYSRKNNKNSNTLKIVSDINYCEKDKIYKTYMNNTFFLHTNEFDITLNISKNLEKIINNNITTNLDTIFNLNNNIQYSNIHKIFSTKNGWGINLL